MDRGAGWATVPGLIRVGHDLATKRDNNSTSNTHLSYFIIIKVPI